MAKERAISFEEWEVQGRALFGEDKFEWEFVCPSCGNIQRPRDFLPYKDRGATPETAFQVCIGRFDGHMNAHMGSGESPCNYTSFGLLNINPVEVTKDDKIYRVFAFNRKEGGSEE